MTRPKNLGGVVFGLVGVGFMLSFGFALGWDDTTRRGLPVWFLGAVGVACFLGVVVESWRRPRRGID